jgi:Uma2 family endonuclease
MVAESQMMTAFEYELLPETGEPTELIDGELMVSAEPTPRHQLIAGRIQRALGNEAESRNLGEWFPPLNLWISPYNIFAPDLLFFTVDQLPDLDKPTVMETPLIVVEIHSPSTRALDLIRKRSRYADRGIAEYWVVDPVARTLIVNIRDERGIYVDVEMISNKIPSGIFEGSRLDLEWVMGDKKSRDH